MKISYFTLFVGIIIILWIIYLMQYYFSMRKNTNNKYTEGFTPKIKQVYRPYIRSFNNTYENFMNNYGSTYILNKLRRWSIY
jgi:hypothetical protein